jgi:hypothetical protein
MPSVFNKHGTDPIPQDAVYIGRPSLWGNPFEIGKDGCREEVIRKYRVYLRNSPDLVEEIKKQLKGKDLICFCAPKSCHGDVILEIANSIF